MTEQEMREAVVPTPESIQDLAHYIESLIGQEHDYGTCVYAMSMAATAAFNLVASRLGVTGFQASCADLDIIRRTRLIDGPFMLIKGADMLYPQYNLHNKLSEAMLEWGGWAKEQAQKKLKEHEGSENTVHPNVLLHWKTLAA